MRRHTLALTLLLTTQCSCIVIGGYSSTGGWYVWPGGLGLLIIMIFLVLLLSRRRRR